MVLQGYFYRVSVPEYLVKSYFFGVRAAFQFGVCCLFLQCMPLSRGCASVWPVGASREVVALDSTCTQSLVTWQWQ